MPTISNEDENFCSNTPKCFPMGSSFGKNFFTNAWFTTATSCEVAVSLSVNPLPRTIGCPTVSKNRVLTLSHEELLWSFGPGAGRPLTNTPSPQLFPSSVLYSARPTLCTPGKDPN